MVRLALLFAVLSTLSLAPVSCAKRSDNPAAEQQAPVAPAAKPAEEAAPVAPSPGAQDPEKTKDTPRKGLRTPDHLPPLARRILHEQMLRHGDHAESLLWSALMLDHEAAQEIAGWVASEVTIARPIAGHEDALNSLLPAAFFAQQDALRAAAKRLGDAARARDDAALGQAYGELTQTCVACHSLYLRLPAPAGDEP